MGQLAKEWELRPQMDLNLDPQASDCPEDEQFFALARSNTKVGPCRAAYHDFYFVGAVRPSAPSHVCKPPLSTPCGYASLPDVPSEILHFAAKTARCAASPHESRDWMAQAMGGELSREQYLDVAAWIGDFYPRFGPPSTLHKHLFDSASYATLDTRIGPMAKQPWLCERVRWRSGEPDWEHHGIVAIKKSYMHTEILVSEVYVCHEGALLRKEAIKLLLEAYMRNSYQREPEERICHP
jgi:hypothetical protein